LEVKERLLRICFVTAEEKGKETVAIAGDASSSPREPRLDEFVGEFAALEMLSKSGTKRLFGGGVN
jgi:hypothetical protein